MPALPGCAFLFTTVNQIFELCIAECLPIWSIIVVSRPGPSRELIMDVVLR
jgi:hypothetical protein